MKTIRLTFRLLDEVVVSARAATMGNHESLDHIPGSAFLGCAAARLYREWKVRRDGEAPSWAWAAFHSGRVRFGNAYPLAPSGCRAIPAPLSWHYPKGEGPTSASVQNCAVKGWDIERQGQPMQIRAGWVSQQSEWIEVRKRYRLKTAIDEDRFDRAKDGSLFGFSSLPEGSRWGSVIGADDDVAEGLWAALKERFAVGGVLRVGRSRNTEYGRVKIEGADADSGDGLGCLPEACAGGLVLVHALSDLALLDAVGQPTLEPDAAAFDLSGARLCPGRTFLRVRTYAAFNLFRNAFDLERQVMAKGSVLAFEPEVEGGKIGFAPGVRWVGAHRQDGLGHVAVQPGYLMSAEPPLAQAEAESVREATPSRPESPTIRAMIRRYEERQIQLLATELARKWSEGWSGFGQISSSQWARLREEAASAESLEKLCDALDHKTDGLFHHGAMSKKWCDEKKGRRAEKVILDCLKSESLNKVLDDAGIGERHADRLGLIACREAAILVARRKGER